VDGLIDDLTKSLKYKTFGGRHTRFLKKLAAYLRLIIMVCFRLIIMVRYGPCC